MISLKSCIVEPAAKPLELQTPTLNMPAPKCKSENPLSLAPARSKPSTDPRPHGLVGMHLDSFYGACLQLLCCQERVYRIQYAVRYIKYEYQLMLHYVSSYNYKHPTVVITLDSGGRRVQGHSREQDCTGVVHRS